jgi:PAS domain S-box-containing protein
VVVATKSHRAGLLERLEERGFDVADAIEKGLYVSVDADETLRKIMRDGRPDRARFRTIVGRLIESSRKSSGESRVAVFGEMVALLLAEGRPDAAVELEGLWNDLLQTHTFSLLCAYPMTAFGRKEDSELFQKVCAEHSGVVPSEVPAASATEDEHLRTIAHLQQKTQALEGEIGRRQSEERIRRLVEGVQDYAIFLLDAEGRICSWNVGAERIKGYRSGEIIGQHFSVFYPREDIESGKPARELEIASKEGRVEDEGWRLRKDGSRFYADVVITAIRDRDGNVTGFTKVTRDVTERMQTQEALRRANEKLAEEIAEKIATERKLNESEQSLRRLSSHLLRLQDEERRRLGRELHDSLGQYLCALKMGLDSVGSSDPQIAECIRLAEQSMTEVRTISYLLYPPMLEELGLKSAIPWYVDGFAKRSGIHTTLHIGEGFGRLSRDTELVIFRILQESLTNVHRHSDSRQAHVFLTAKDGLVSLEVKDEGKGIPSEVLDSARETRGNVGVGLRGMSERARQLGGNLELTSAPCGTTVHATLPFEEWVPVEYPA